MINNQVYNSAFGLHQRGISGALTLFCLLFIPVMGQAHGYWLDVKGSGKLNTPVTIQVCYGEIDEYGIRHREVGDELALLGKFALFVVDQPGQRTNLVMKPRSDCWEATFVPTHKGAYQILGYCQDMPIVDRSTSGGQTIRPIDYLCAAYVVDSPEVVRQPRQLLDILTQPNGKLITVQVFKNNARVGAGVKLRVFNPENWEKNLETNAQGEAVFMPTLKGLYIIRQDWVEPKAGTYEGKSYGSIRHRCNYCLWVP